MNRTIYLAAAAAILLSVAPASADGFTCAIGLQPVSNCAGAGDAFSQGGRGTEISVKTVDDDGNIISITSEPVDGGYRGPHNITRHDDSDGAGGAEAARGAAR